MSRNILRWSIALVLGGGALLLLVHGQPVHAIPIAALELAGAALFVVPRTRRLGAYALLASLAAAAALHAWLGAVPPPSFVVYAAAIWVSL